LQNPTNLGGKRMLIKNGFWMRTISILFVYVFLFISDTRASELSAVTVTTSLGSIGTASELIICPLIGKTIRDANWIYQTLPDGTPNPFYPPLTSPTTLPVNPPDPAISNLSQSWPSWDIAQNIVVNSNDQKASMKEVLFDSVNTVTVATEGVIIYVNSQVNCEHQKSYKAYLTSKGIQYTQIETTSIQDYGKLVGSLNYLSPGGEVIPLLLINGEPVVGKWRASTQARIDLLLKKYGFMP